MALELFMTWLIWFYGIAWIDLSRRKESPTSHRADLKINCDTPYLGDSLAGRSLCNNLFNEAEASVGGKR